MNETPKISQTRDEGSQERIVMISVIGGLLGMAIFAAAAESVFKESLFVIVGLLFGWLSFLERNIAQFQPDPPTLAVGVVAFVLLVFAIHRIGSGSKKPVATVLSPNWSWRSTLAVSSGLLVLFAASIAIISSMHQIIWISTGSRLPASRAAAWSAPSGPLSPVRHARQAALRTESKNNIKMMMMALHNYHDTYNMLPPGAIVTSTGRGYRGWVPAIGPFHSFMDGWWREGQPAWDDPSVADLGKGALYGFVHPDLGWNGQFDERDFAVMHYAANVHLFPTNQGMNLKDVKDGLQHTIAIGEVAENFQAWASPWNRRDPADGINDVPWGFGGPTWQNGAQFGFLDGSVRLLSKNIDRKVLKAMGTPTGGETIPDEVLPRPKAAVQ